MIVDTVALSATVMSGQSGILKPSAEIMKNGGCYD